MLEAGVQANEAPRFLPDASKLQAGDAGDGDFDSPKSGVHEIYWGSRPLNEAIGQSGWPYESVSRAERDVRFLG